MSLEIPYVPPSILPARNGRPVTEQPPAEELRRIRVTPASQIPLRIVRWAWDTAPDDAHPSRREGRIPVGSFVIAAGWAGIGKSQMACWITAQVTAGLLPGCWVGRPRAVIYAASEDSWSMTIVPRLIAAGADLDRVFRVDTMDILNVPGLLSLPRDLPGLEEIVRDHDVAMIVMDPMLSLLDNGLDDYRAKEVRAALEPLVGMADRTGAVVLAIAHFIKGGGGDPLHLVAGSAAFGQLIRAGLGFARMETGTDGDEPNEPRFVMSTIKNNVGRKEDLPSLEYRIEPWPVATPEGETWVSRVTFTGAPCHVSVQMMMTTQTDARSRDAEEDRDEAAEWLAGYLVDMGGEASAGDVLKAGLVAGGWSKATLHRAKKKLGVTSAKAQNRGAHSPWLWSLTVTTGGQGTDKVTRSLPPEPQNLETLYGPLDALPTESEW